MPKLKKRRAVYSKRKYHYNVTNEELTDSIEPSVPSDSSSVLPPCRTSSSEVQTEIDTKCSETQTEIDTKCSETQTEYETASSHTQTETFHEDHSYAEPMDLSISNDNKYEQSDQQFLEVHVLDISDTSHISLSDDDISVVHEAEEAVAYTVKYSDFIMEINEKFRRSDFVVKSNETGLQLLKLYDHNDTPSVQLSVNINSDFMCELFVHRRKIGKAHSVWEGLPLLFDRVEALEKLCDRLQKFNICPGNPEEEYKELVPVGAGLSSNSSPAIIAYREGDFQALHGPSGLEYSSTIRSVDCKLLTDKKFKCKHCMEYGYALKKRKSRLDERLNSKRAYSHTNFKHSDMTREELTKKLFEQKDEIDSLQHKVWKMKRDFEKEILKRGVEVQQHTHKELSDLMASCQPEFEKSFPESSGRQRLFWEQQLLQSQKADKRGMRWHPMIIRWCLYIRQTSAKAYDALRDSGFISLPSSRTLFDYSHYIKSELGLQGDVIKMLQEEAQKKGLYEAPWRKYIGLLFDEIKIKEDLVYDKHSGELIGYCNLGDVGNQMQNFDNLISGTSQDLAKYILVVMIRSVPCNFCFPLCTFATKSITADYLYPIIWRTVGFIETQLKLHVLFFTCDGASPNRRFFGLHRVGNESVVYKTTNPFNDMDQNIYFISDVPHLLKTLRNNFSNSFSHKKTRNLWKNGKDISWFHIVRLFEEHCELNLYSPCPKLTRKHVDLVSFNYMKVNLAAQVISDSVANCLEDLYGQETSETVKFVRIFNKFFDCLNVRSLFEGRNKRNENLNAYRSENDARLVFLTEELMQYLNDWEDDVNNRNGNLTKEQRSSMLLSHQTVSGLKITVNSISECIKFLLGEGASYVLTHSFNQDPLEQHFGHYRHKAGANNNPSVYDVRNTLTKIRTVNAQAIPARQGNIRRGQLNFDIDHSKLPRRR